MRTLLVAAVALPLVGLTPPAPAEPPVPRHVSEWEGRFLAMPSPDNMREAMRRLTARPHHVGSAYGRENAEWILARFREWGWEAQIETFDVLFPTPKERLVEMIEPTRVPRSRSRSRRSRRTRPAARRPSSSPPTTRTRSTAT